MSAKELTRCDVINRVCNKELKQAKAAEMLTISIRQIKRLCRSYRQEDAHGMISKKRGKASNK